MKKLISLALVLLMTLGCIGTSFAAEVSSDGLTVDGWNGWTVKSGTAITTQANPLAGDTAQRGTVVKVTEGSAERYFAQWFTGVIELSVDVYGEGTISFGDSNGRSAGSVVLANGSINGTACSYNAAAWNTVKLLVATGTKETEVYLGDTYVTTLTLASLVRPTKLVVSSDSTIYVDNIKISELMKTAPYADNELTSVYTSDFAANGIIGWNNTGSIADVAEVDGESVVSLTKSNGETGNHRFRKALTTEGNLVFEAELLQDATNPQTSGLSVFLRGKNASTSGEGRALDILSFDNGYILLGSDRISSETFKTEPLYKKGEWFKVKVEVLTENQSMILYVANKNANGEYGDWVRVNDKPVRFYSSESNVTNNEVHTAFEELVFNLHSGSATEGLWYLKSVNLSTLATTKTETVFSENFDNYNPATSKLQCVNNGTADQGSYLTFDAVDLDLTKYPISGEEIATPANKVGKIRFSGIGRSATSDPTVHVVEGYQTTTNTNLNNADTDKIDTGAFTYITSRDPETEYLRVQGLDFEANATQISVKMDFFNSAIARKKSGSNTVRGSLNIALSDSDNVSDIDVGFSVSSTTLSLLNYDEAASGNMYVSNLPDKQAWDRAEYTVQPYSSENNLKLGGYKANSTTGKGVFSSVSRYDSKVTEKLIDDLSELRIYIPSYEGGLYYMDNIEITATYPIGGVGYIKKEYSAYNTFTDAITRGNVADIALRYVDFEDADGNVSGIPTADSKVKSVTIEENAIVAAGTKLIVGVFEGDKLSDTAIIDVENGKSTYTINETLSTTANSVVKVFIWDMNTLVPLTTAEKIDKADRTKLVLLGDSIVCDYKESEERRGWGQLLGNYVNTNKLEIVNYAISGASTADYLNTPGVSEGADRSEYYNNAINALSTGDYLMISLTTNDSSRFGIDEFSANIQTMIDDVEEKGATPILVTTHPRCKYIAEHINRYLVGDGYYAWIKEMERLAALNNIPVINLYEMAVDSYDTGNINAETGYDDDILTLYVGGTDVTHLNENGADFAASLIAKGMAQLNCGIEDFVK